MKRSDGSEATQSERAAKPGRDPRAIQPVREVLRDLPAPETAVSGH
jgi:hypothetical protein